MIPIRDVEFIIMRLIYFSPVSWYSYEQRPHYLVDYALRHGIDKVLWVEPIPTRLPNIGDVQRIFGKTPNHAMKQLPIDVEVISLPTLPIEPIPVLRELNTYGCWANLWQRFIDFAKHTECIVGIGKPNRFALFLLRKLKCRSFYDAMDDFPYFYKGISRYSMINIEHACAKQVDHIITSSTFLKEKFLHLGFESQLILNAYPDHDLSHIELSEERSKIVLGYVGTIGNWFDWDFTIALAKAIPEAELRIIGPCYSSSKHDVPINIKLLGEMPRNKVLHEAKEFSVGLIPFKLTTLTQAVDPIKYYEYRFLGLPVLSTKFGEMAHRDKRDYVYHVTKNADFKSTLESILKNKPSKQETDQFRLKNNWDVRFDTMKGIFV